VDHLDLFQTLAAAAGIQPPANRNYAGRSFLALLESGNSSRDWRTVQFGEYGPLRMARTATHKLIRRSPNGPHALFDLVADPRETVNRIDDPSLAPVIAELTTRLEAHFNRYAEPDKSGLLGSALPRYNNTAAWL
jgi:arylsulfatase A-like enzyme